MKMEEDERRWRCGDEEEMVREGRMGSGRAPRKNGRKEKEVTEGKMKRLEKMTNREKIKDEIKDGRMIGGRRVKVRRWKEREVEKGTEC